MNQYIINTFISERNRYYDTSINYYKAKTKALLDSLKNAHNNQLINQLKSIENVDEIFNKSVSNFGNLGLTWNMIYNSRMSQESIASAIQKYNEKTHQLDDSFNYQVDARIFLQQLLGEVPGGDQIDLSQVKLPETLDFNSVKKEFNRLSKQEYSNASAVGGARAKLFGEIFEQLALNLIANNIGELMEWVDQMGTAQSYNYSGRVSSGKSDIMIGVNRVEVVNDLEEIKGKLRKVTKLQGDESLIEIDAAEAIDLEDKQSVDALTLKYTTGERAGIAGGTVKQWISEGPKATLAHSNFTARYINTRQPEGISDNFKNKETFDAYTAYVLARFLINVIGVYNILMISGGHIELTHNFLERVKDSNLSIMHFTELSNSLYKAKNDVYVGRNPLVSEVV